MAFEKIAKNSGRGNHRKTKSVSIGVLVRGRRAGIFVSNDVWVEMGSPEKVAVHKGTDEDYGKIAIVSDPDGYALSPPAKGSRQRRLSISMKPFGYHVYKRYGDLEYTITASKALIITLPKELL